MPSRALLGLLALPLLVTLTGCGADDRHEGRSCEQVRSKDRVMSDVMYCTRSDGSTFYTDWDGALSFESDGTDPDNASSTRPKPPRRKEPSNRAPKPSDRPEDPVSPQEPERSGTTCQDVTSYDENWQNDMLCTRPDGSQFYTDYAGAAAAEG